MNILCIVDQSYVGVTPAGGAETYLHDTLKYLVKKGHRVVVFLSGWTTQATSVDGVQLRSHLNRTLLDEVAANSDILITQLDGTPLAQHIAEKHHLPLVQIVHNTNEFTEGFLAYGVNLAVYNADWVSEYHESVRMGPMTTYWAGKGKARFQLRRQTEWDSIILKPPIDVKDYAVRPNPRGNITLVNPCDNKGQHIFYELARRCPDLTFMPVVGGYQPTKQKFVDLPNVVKHEHVKDMKIVFEKTAVVLMPSTYESYGRVAVEAACAGIPSVVSSTPGLLEAMGDGASYVRPVEAGDLSSVDEWERALRYTLDGWDFCSTKAKERATTLSHKSYVQLRLFESKIKDLVKSWV